MSESEEKGVTILDAVRRAKEIAAAAKANAAPLNGEDPSSRKRPPEDSSSLESGEGGPPVKKPAGIGTSPAAGQIDPKAIARQAIMNLTCRVGLTQMVTVEVKIPNRLVGLVIGHQGEMISRLQAESGARIQVAPDGSEINGERQVTISGTQDTVERAKVLVEKTVREVGLVDLPTITAAGHEVVEMLIPSNKIGLIIGKGGDMIKALQERAGCRMQMLQDGVYSTAPEKPLRMTGNPESCRRARELVIELIEQKELESGNFAITWRGDAESQARGLSVAQMGPAGSGTMEIQVPRPMVGVIIGKNGECINNIQQTCGVRLQFLNDDMKSPFRSATISGSQDGIERANKMVQDIISEKSQMGGGGAVMPSGRPFINLPNPTGPGVVTTQLAVPSTKCGIVIGKSGETIRQLQVQSGCHIELDRGPDMNPNEKIFNIRGAPQAVQAAQNLVWQKCDMAPGSGIVGGGMSFASQQPQGAFQSPGQPMYQQQQQGQQAAYSQPQQVAGTAQNPWGAAYNPYQQFGAQGQQGQAQSATDATTARDH
ncbi:far upstream element-binding protein 3-like isoform X4 [Dysidea avara]|uniref:far upstream element-binding protein 3-like isoform X4 n=1 Tax=Dysidea avara TaxID=196820 RepID=UPI00332D4B41